MYKQRGCAALLIIITLAICLAISAYLFYDSQFQQQQLTTQVDQLNKKLDSTKQKLNDKEVALFEKEAAVSDLNLKNQQLNNEFQTIKESQQQAQATLKETSNKLNKELTEKDKLSKGLSEKLTANKNEYEKQLEKINDFSTTLNQKYQSTRDQLNSELARIENYNSRIETLEQRLKREQNSLAQLRGELSELNKTNKKLSLEKNQLVKQFKDGTTIIRLDNSVLFPSGSARLNQHGQKTLSLVAKTLANFSNHLISVEGHSDQRTIGAVLSKRYPSNWELSSARASAAIRYLAAQGMQNTQFQAVGFGSTRPISTKKSESEQRKNRRIEILLFPALAKQNIKSQKEVSLKNNAASIMEYH